MVSSSSPPCSQDPASTSSDTAAAMISRSAFTPAGNDSNPQVWIGDQFGDRQHGHSVERH